MTLFDARMNSNTICVLVSLRLTREPATDKRRSERSACDEPNGGLRSPALAPSEMSADASPPLIPSRRRNLPGVNGCGVEHGRPSSHPQPPANPLSISGFRRWFRIAYWTPRNCHDRIVSYGFGTRRAGAGFCLWGCPCLSLITNEAEEMRASRGQGELPGGFGNAGRPKSARWHRCCARMPVELTDAGAGARIADRGCWRCLIST
jgi:hypothetical protein